VYAFGIGPLVQLILRIMPRRLLFHDFGAPGRSRSGQGPDTTMGECPTASVKPIQTC
jgi:hypothetical protein